MGTSERSTLQRLRRERPRDATETLVVRRAQTVGGRHAIVSLFLVGGPSKHGSAVTCKIVAHDPDTCEAKVLLLKNWDGSEWGLTPAPLPGAHSPRCARRGDGWGKGSEGRSEGHGRWVLQQLAAMTHSGTYELAAFSFGDDLAAADARRVFLGLGSRKGPQGGAPLGEVARALRRVRDGHATEGGGARMLNDTVMRLEEESGPVTFEKLVGAMHEAWEWAAKAAPRNSNSN